HGQDRRIGLKRRAIGTAHDDLPGRLFDRCYCCAEMEPSAVLAAFGCEKLDQRTVTPNNASVLPVVPCRPLVAERQGAEAPRVGGVVTLDCPRDRASQLGV